MYTTVRPNKKNVSTGTKTTLWKSIIRDILNLPVEKGGLVCSSRVWSMPGLANKIHIRNNRKP